MIDGYLHRHFLNNGSRELLKWVHYFDIYERYFARYRGKSPVFLEIGVAFGASVAMWKDYLGPGCQIIGLDIAESAKIHESPGIDIFIGSQDDPAILDEILQKYPNIDIVLDDGSHRNEHMRASFEHLYDKISGNGIYMVEDTHTCYWDEFGGRGNSFVEHAKVLVDELNIIAKREKEPVTHFAKTTQGIHFYDSVVVFEKRLQGRRLMPITGPM